MATITGTEDDDVLNGTTPDPFAGGGDDIIRGLGGNDIINGLGGTDDLDGGDGNDVFRFTVGDYGGHAAYATITGGNGFDTLDYSNWGDRVVIDESTAGDGSGQPVGALRVSGGLATGIERIIGSSREMYANLINPIELIAGAADDTLSIANGGAVSGLDGNDRISVGNGGVGHGNAGSDFMTLTGVGSIYGDEGADIFYLQATASGALIDGGAGIDEFRFRTGDTIDLQAGTLMRPTASGYIATTLLNIESATFSAHTEWGPTTIYGSGGADFLSLAEGLGESSPAHFYGREGDDTLRGDAGNDVLDGGAGDDRLGGNIGNNLIYGGSGNDTVSIGGRFINVSLTFAADHVDIVRLENENYIGGSYQGAGGVDRVYGVETFNFIDGTTINRADGKPLVDDLYYYAVNRDVFNARVDPDAHFAEFGWREGRDPNQFFDTSAYLGANKDLAAGNGNPLDHYALYGAREGRDPSVLFDSEQYLARNADVAAAGINPLQHYLEYGQAEGRAIYAAVGTLLIGDFDPEYYLLKNTDVAAAGVDPLSHYLQYGAAEGRDPNAYFDTSYYLEHNADIAAAGVNPLMHFEEYGWREGRDPSAAFDTSFYLQAAPDVAAANIDPLHHYLTDGRLEGRMIHDIVGTASSDYLLA